VVNTVNIPMIVKVSALPCNDTISNSLPHVSVGGGERRREMSPDVLLAEPDITFTGCVVVI